VISYPSSSGLTVVQSLPQWLPLTATWLHNQIRFLPPEITSHIVCEATENLDQFAIPNLYSLGSQQRRSCWSNLTKKFFHGLRLNSLLARRLVDFQLQVARNHKATILHSHWGDVGWRDLTAARKGKMAHVVTFYGKDVNYYPQSSVWRKRYEQLFKRVNLVLCEGLHMANCIVRLGCPKAKVRVQHLGVDVDNIAFEPRAWRSGPLRVLIAGSFREKKGIPYALEALGLLRKEVPDLEITVIGDESKDPRSHPEKTKILETLKKYQMQDNTRMLGYQSHAVLFAEAYNHHVFMSPSVTASDGDTEGGAPVTILEMAASGMPIISTTHCDIPSIVIHGKTGLLAAERDVAGLLQHLRWLVTHPEHWEAMVMEGRLHVEAEYNVVKQSESLGSIYKSVGFER